MFAAMPGVKSLSRGKSICRDMRKATMLPIYFNVKSVSDDSIESTTSNLFILALMLYIWVVMYTVGLGIDKMKEM